MKVQDLASYWHYNLDGANPGLLSTSFILLVTNPREINKPFADLFKDLYKPKDSMDMVECHKFLHDIDLPQLTLSESE